MTNPRPRSTFLFLILTLSFMLAVAAAVMAQAPKPGPNNIDKGDFKVGFSPATKAKNPKKAMPKEIADPLVELAKSLNDIIALPFDVFLNFDQCGEPNAFYDPNTKEITVCYEFYEDIEEAFKTAYKDPAKIADMTEGAMVVFLFHELGHCLIDVWDLPATGREEDAVDQLAMFILLDGTPEGEGMVLAAAEYFNLTSRDRDPEELEFWDEHSLDQQRFYDMLCLTYGSNPAKNKKLIGKNALPAERAGRCQEEFNRVDSAWKKLLTPYLK